MCDVLRYPSPRFLPAVKRARLFLKNGLSIRNRACRGNYAHEIERSNVLIPRQLSRRFLSFLSLSFFVRIRAKSPRAPC